MGVGIWHFKSSLDAWGEAGGARGEDYSLCLRKLEGSKQQTPLGSLVLRRDRSIPFTLPHIL